MRVVFAAEKPLEGELSLIAPDGSVAAKSHERRGGPPYFWYAEVGTPAAGTWHARLARERAPAECSTLTYDIAVLDHEPPRPHGAPGSVWPVRYLNRATENLFSAWIERLFDAPLDARPRGTRSTRCCAIARAISCSTTSVSARIRSGRRPPRLRRPAVLPARVFRVQAGPALRVVALLARRQAAGEAVFVVQHPGPTRRTPARPPNIASGAPRSGHPNHRPAGRATDGEAARACGVVRQRLRVLADGVHSGSARTPRTTRAPTTIRSCFRTRHSGRAPCTPIRTGTVILVRRVPQTSGRRGVFLAVDGQPDGTVARKRFWRGNFLFAQDPALGGPGFKRFRPIVTDKSGAERRLTNEEIAKNPQYADFSLDQARLTPDAFYDGMDDVMSPAPLDPMRAMGEAITSLEEQVKARVTSVENGRKYQSSGRGDVEMPNGPSIFETTGAWEDFATPARDLRLLIAIDVVLGFPDRVARRPERYAMPAGKSVADVKAELQNMLASELATRKFSYMRTDGSAWTLALKDVAERAPSLEMAYNLNDCVELRWGAPERSEEASTCKRHASGAQRSKMTEYRAWFHERRRPPRA